MGLKVMDDFRNQTGRPDVKAFPDPETNTISYVVVDPATRMAAVIDSVLDIDYAAGRLSYQSADAIIAFIEAEHLSDAWLIEPHVHADHLSAAPYIKEKVGGKIGIGDKITVVQDTFGKVFNEGTEFHRDGSQFDRLFKDGDGYRVGELEAFALSTPGHTPACMTHVIGDAAFVGDTLFMPDAGTARADFPGGDAHALYRSARRILELPTSTRLFMCHDYGTSERGMAWETTVAEERERNIHVGDGIGEQDFVDKRVARDATLAMPRLILPSLQVNMKAGNLPEADASGKRFLKVPINGL